jgi:hypothetical protein
MNILKFISNLFKKKKTTIPVVEEKSGPGIIELIEAEKKDYKENFGMMIPENGLTPQEVEGIQKIFEPEPPAESSPRRKSLKDLQASVPKRATKSYAIPPTSTATKAFVSPEFDYTPNPLKYWRRFKRGKKIFWKKFYNETSLGYGEL